MFKKLKLSLLKNFTKGRFSDRPLLIIGISANCKLEMLDVD